METSKAYSYIRFSTPEQLKGDSLRRQLEASEKYVKEHGLILDTSINLQDLGKSAYKGQHRTRGALGQFLKLVETGRIEKGSVLLVEHLDRLSREEVNDAYDQFRSILKAGIKIVTLQDGIEYTKDGNLIQLITSIIYMSQANQESEKKSIRLSSAWANKRVQVTNGKVKLTGKVPQWIKKVKDDFELIPEIVQVIKVIYNKKLSGYGNDRIARELNRNPDIWKPKKGKRNILGGWQKSTITKLLSNRELIGEFKLGKMVNGKREEIGETILNYFPKAIDESLFYQVQERIQNNSEKNGHAGGRSGKATNVFAHIAKCGICKSPMHFIDKGKPPKGGQYLHCSNSRSNLNCSAKPIQYQEFEKLFFDNMEELDINQLIPDKDYSMSRINEIEKTIRSNQGKLFELNQQIDRLGKRILRIESEDTAKTLTHVMTEAINERKGLEQQIEELDKEKQELRNQYRELTQNIDLTKQIYELLASAIDEQEQTNIRLKLRATISNLIDYIQIYPLRDSVEKLVELKIKYSELLKSLEGKRLTMGEGMRLNALAQSIRDEEEILKPDSGIVAIMQSKYIDKIRIKFKGSGDLRVLYLKSYVNE